jgi:signal transduction histidine kinase
MRSPSLLTRFAVGIVLTNIFVYFVAWPVTAVVATYLGLAVTDSVNYWAEYRAQEVVRESLVRESDGSARIEPSPGLRAFAQRNPNFRFAIIDRRTNSVLPGSSEELARAFLGGGEVRVLRTYFRIESDPDPDARGVFREIAKPFSAVVYGYTLHWSDLFAVMRMLADITQIVPVAPFAIFAILATWLATRYGLTPLYAAKEQLAKIDLKSIDQRIQSSKAPKEIAPFLEAINATLARLEDSARQQQRFTANAAHELLTPMAILRARLDAPNESTFLQDLDRDMRRLQSIVEQLLILARGADGGRIVTEKVDLGALVRRMIADYLPLIVDSGRNIAFDPPPAPVFVRANQPALECIVSNLINNALRAEPVGGTIEIRVRSGAFVEVADHGEGIADNDCELIFEPFWRKTEATRGAGLGLSIVKELVEKQGGTISVSKTPGGGATFTASFAAFETM